MEKIIRPMIVLLAVNAAAGDIVQASENAWREHMNPLKLEVLNVTDKNILEALSSKLKEMDEDAPVVVSDVSVMPLRSVPLSLMDMPFTYRHPADRHVLPFIATAGELLELLEHGKNIVNLADLKMSVQMLHGHNLPFDTEWQTDCILLPIATKEPSPDMVRRYVLTKYYIRFKPGCVSPTTIKLMRELFPSTQGGQDGDVDDNPDAAEAKPDAEEEGKKNKEDEI